MRVSQPVKVSDALLLDARIAGEVVERSIAGQIEFWAKIGRALEPLLRGDHVLALCRSGEVKPLSACLKSVDSSAGRQRVFEHLETRPYPHYEADSELPGLLVRIEADGRRTTGRFVNRQFQPVKIASKKKAKPALSGASR
jgi:ParD-like antitoxin of type II bacterial toxin-antitoxin system